MTEKERAQETAGLNRNGKTPLPLFAASHLPEPKKGASRDSPGVSLEPTATGRLTSALLICRNKHWRYISSFHGPWLQLPPEVLESLAYSNYLSPRPHPIDPAVFFDLVKIRRLVEEATNLAVRATNGTTSSALSASLNAANGPFGGGGAAALGLGIVGSSGNARLSKERKYRMRELATQKLSEAYNLDEIATSVATMQSASPLEDVAKMALQRDKNNVDAKYVHFFHEKIPSRMLAQCTSLASLDDIIRDRPGEAAFLRTRAVTRIFKTDFPGAIGDLTEALTLCRLSKSQHRSARGQLQLTNGSGGAERKHDTSGGLSYEVDTGRTDRLTSLPTSLEPQLLFHRAGVYLNRACQYINEALNGLGTKTSPTTKDNIGSADPLNTTKSGIDSNKLRDNARKLVKAYAKRALRDYIGFLSSFEYTPGLPLGFAEEFRRKVDLSAERGSLTASFHGSRLLQMPGNSSLSNGTFSEMALRPELKGERHHHGCTSKFKHDACQSLPVPDIHQVANLFSSAPPNNIPPYPVTLQSLVPRQQIGPSTTSEMSKRFLAGPMYQEAVTYHPLLTDALHSVLLCHSLMQTSAKEHLRHAYMVARLARVCDGYPIFLAARSPSRADWIEVIQRANNWLDLQQSWENLCAPAPLPGQTTFAKRKPEKVSRERQRQEVRIETLADDRVHDVVNNQAAVADRERLAEEPKSEQQRPSVDGPQRWAQSDGKEYPVSTERAEAIARWVREAPSGVEVRRAFKRNGKEAPATQPLGLMDFEALPPQRAEGSNEVAIRLVNS
ncbi:hypothetical protein MMC26_007633 [Xylographa opegraphella]|nr:hypothetical protein [Xylographa opegraphella]